jgi:hypothetical protein
MENSIQTEKQNLEEILLQETQQDEYWTKKYDISIEELKKTANTALSDIIIAAGIKHKSFSL